MANWWQSLSYSNKKAFILQYLLLGCMSFLFIDQKGLWICILSMITLLLISKAIDLRRTMLAMDKHSGYRFMDMGQGCLIEFNILRAVDGSVYELDLVEPYSFGGKEYTSIHIFANLPVEQWPFPVEKVVLPTEDAFLKLPVCTPTVESIANKNGILEVHLTMEAKADV